MIQFEVIGLPAPQGSKTLMPNGVMLDGKLAAARRKHKEWRNAVQAAAHDVARHDDVTAPLDGPLGVEIQFYMPMPKSRSAADRKRGWCWHSVKPDIDKTTRSTLDGLTAGGLIKDDSRVARLEVEATEWPGEPYAVVTITELGYP